MGIALLATALLQNLTQTGFHHALIQRAGDIRPYLDTAWTMGLIRSLLLVGVLVLLAPFIANFFGDDRAIPLLRILALSLFIYSLTSIRVVYFQKGLEFQKRFFFMAAQSLTVVGVGITLALTLRNVWALVYADLAGAAIHVVLSYVMQPHRPRLRMEWSKARELFRYGKWIFCSTALNYLVCHLDDLLVGRIVGAAGLGLYRMAYTQSELATAEVTKVAGQVLFPAYSKLQERQNDLRRAYLQSLSVFAFLSFPLSGGFLFLALPFTQLILGEKWVAMVPALQVLIIWGLVRAIAGTNGSLFSGIGRPGLNTKLHLARAVLLGTLVYPLVVTWGITGAAVAVLLAALPFDAASFYMANRLVHSPISSIKQVALFPFLNTILMLLALYLAQRAIDPHAGIGQLLILVVLGGLAYGAGVALCRVAFGYTIGGILTGRRLKALLASGG
jgi:O-antigen/teichoic acid export membrane protein